MKINVFINPNLDKNLIAIEENEITLHFNSIDSYQYFWKTFASSIKFTNIPYEDATINDIKNISTLIYLKNV